MCEKCVELEEQLVAMKYNYEQLVIGLERQWRIARGNFDLCYPQPKTGEPLIA